MFVHAATVFSNNSSSSLTPVPAPLPPDPLLVRALLVLTPGPREEQATRSVSIWEEDNVRRF
jgi:hypothetical protein